MNRKQILIGAAIVVLVVAIYLAVKKYKEGKLEIPFVSTQAPPSGSGLNESKMLKQGTSGAEVEELQAFLNDVFGESLEIDGIFGPLTEAALLSSAGVNQITLEELYEFEDVNTVPSGLMPNK